MADSSISDHIGRLGEIHFDNLANRARLLSCRLDPDRIGRDRIVEFELEDCAGGPSYDTRPAPIGCSVQIKTVLWHTRDVRISLSNAMRMAGDPRPTFICVIRVDRRGDVVDMRFIHLVGDNLARVLERLRRASQSSEERLSKKTISFDLRSGDIIASAPEAIRDYLARAIGGNLETYAFRKISQKNSLGYPDVGRFSFKFSVETESVEDLYDFYLGLKDLRATDFAAFEERFGIALPHNIGEGYAFSAGRISVRPTSSGFADVTVRSADATDEACISFEVISPPSVLSVGEYFKFILRSAMIEIVVKSGSIHVSTTEKFRLDSVNYLDSWYSIFDFLRLAFRSGSRLFLKDKDGDLQELGSGAQSTVEGKDKFVASVCDLISRLKILCQFGNIHTEPFSVRQLIDAHANIDLVYAYMFDTARLGSLSFEVGTELAESPPDARMLFAHRLDIIGVDVVAIMRCNVALECLDGGTVFRSTSMHPVSLRPSPPGEKDFQLMIETLARAIEANCILVSDNRNPPENFEGI